jgi:GntR family transcriptional repressor for pyruvate dehydrogenase complex
MSAEPQDDARFPRLKQEGALYKRIAKHVHDLIVTEQLRPGDRLPAERQLAEMLGVSRVPIREAMRSLAAQGLIEVRRGHGMFVAERSVDAAVDEFTLTLLRHRGVLAELFAVRRLLEPASAQWAAVRAQPDEVEAMRRIVGDMEALGATDPPDYEAFGDRDVELHIHIATAARNRVLVRIMQAIQDLHRDQIETSLRYRDRVHETLDDHRRIVAAIEAGDPVLAGQVMSEHLDRSEAASMARIEGGPPPDED